MATTKQAYEQTSSWYSAVLKDQSDTAIGVSSISTLNVTLYEPHGGATINGRDAQDVKNSGAWDKGVTVTANGTVTFALEADDNAIVNSDNDGRPEVHVIVFAGTTTGTPSYAFKHRYEYQVINLPKTS